MNEEENESEQSETKTITTTTPNNVKRKRKRIRGSRVLKTTDVVAPLIHCQIADPGRSITTSLWFPLELGQH